MGGLLLLAAFAFYAEGRATRQDVEKEIEKLPPVQIDVYRKLLDDKYVLTELRKIA